MTVVSRAERDGEEPLVYASPQRLVDHLTRLFVISDTHFFHERLHTVLAPGVRPANSHELMVERWKETIADDDIVLHLGDVAVGIDPDTYVDRIPRLPGDIFLLPGNHDRSRRKLLAYRMLGWQLIRPFSVPHGGWTLTFRHEPIPLVELGARVINVHGHIHEKQSPGPRYINCSVEQIDYRPILVRRLVEQKIEELTLFPTA